MKKFCFTFSCLLAFATLSASAQTGPVIDLGSAHLGSHPTTEVTVTITTAGKADGIAVDTEGQASVHDFTQRAGGTCAIGSTYSVGDTCTIRVVFAPTFGEMRYGAIILTDAGGNQLSTTLLQATGIGPQASFSPGLEFPIATTFNPSSIALGKDGTVLIPEQGFGLGGSYVEGGMAISTPTNASAYSSQQSGPGALVSPNLWTDQVGNYYISSVSVGTAYSFTKDGNWGLYISDAADIESFSGDIPGNLFAAKSNTVYKYTPQLNSCTAASFPCDQDHTAYTETTFATGSKVWSDWFGDIYIPSNGEFNQYASLPDGTYLELPVLDSLTTIVSVDGHGNIYGYVGGLSGLYKETLESNSAFTISSLPVGIPNPGLLTADGVGNLYYTKLLEDDTASYGPAYYSVIKEDFTAPPALTFATTPKGSTSTGSGRAVTITNRGNLPLQFSEVNYPLDFPEHAGATNDCQPGTSLQYEQSCTVTIDFKPLTPVNSTNTPVTLSEVVKVITNTLNAPATEQDIAVSGTEGFAPAATPAYSITGGTFNNAPTVAITDATPRATIYYTINGATPTTSSSKYTGPITLKNTSTLQAIAVATGASTSSIASSTYTLLAAAPHISPTGGVDAAPLTVTITTATAGARIFYSLSGLHIAQGATLYTGPIAIDSSVTINTYANKTGYTDSPLVTASFIVQAPPFAPVFSVPGGTYDNAQTIAITDVPGAAIYYTLNGTTPTSASAKYTTPLTIKNSETLTAIAIAPGYSPTAPTSATYALAAGAPSVNLLAGTYAGTQQVTVTTTSASAKIYYTTNGADPMTSSARYTGPLTISASKTFKFIAIATGYANSSIVTNQYVIQ